MTEPASPEKLPDQAVRDQVERICRSAPFAQSDRMNRFLRFTVESVLAGKADDLKEYNLGTQVYDRDPAYQPSRDSIVRTEARRLRTKLQQYYGDAGKADPIVIAFTPGSYVPVFRLKSSRRETLAACSSSTEELFVAGSGVAAAIIPFVDLTQTPESTSRARSISDEFLHQLMQTEGFRVTGQSPIAAAIARGADAPSLARDFNLQVVFEGTLRQIGNTLRLTCRAMDANGFQVWSQGLEFELDALEGFALPEKLASAMISRIRPHLSIIRKLRFSVTPSFLNHFPLLAAAESLLDVGGASEIRCALGKFRELVRLAPEFPRAYWGVTQCYFELAQRGVPLSSEDISRATSAAALAVQIDPEAGMAHVAVACSHMLKRDWPAAQESFAQAVAVDESPGACRAQGLFLISTGRVDQGWYYLDTAQDIDPFASGQQLAMARALYFSRRFEEAVQHHHRPNQFGHLPVEAVLYVALAYAQLKDYDGASKLIATIKNTAANQPPAMARIAEIFALCGDPESARQIVSDHNLGSADAPITHYRRALLQLSTGDPTAAVDALEQASHNREVEMIWLNAEPRFDALRTEQRFKAVSTGL